MSDKGPPDIRRGDRNAGWDGLANLSHVSDQLAFRDVVSQDGLGPHDGHIDEAGIGSGDEIVDLHRILSRVAGDPRSGGHAKSELTSDRRDVLEAVSAAE